MTNLNDIILTLKVKADGDDELRPVVDALESLVSASDDVKQHAAGLFDELANSEKAGRAVEQFRATARAVLDLSQQITESRGKVAELGKALSATEAPTKRQVATFELARASLAKLEAQEERQRAKLAELRTALEAQGLATNNLVAAEKTLQQRKQAALAALQGEARAYAASRVEAERLAASKREEEQASLRTVRANTSAAESLRRYQASARDATQDNARLAASSERIGGVFSRLRGIAASVLTYLSFRSALEGVKNILGLGDAAERTRNRLAELFGSTSAGEEAFQRIRAIARDNGLAFDTALSAATRLKSFGIDPLNGSLQGLIDQNAKLGGSQESLEGIVLALGQAWAKQKLQGEEILQLVERGVPVWDLLSKATGKSTLELQKLSEQGKLGRDVISLLFQEIGRSSQGAAAKNLGTLSGLFAQLTDRAQQFFVRISNAGALDYFKTRIAELIARVDELAENGELEAWAKRISDAIIGAAKAVANAGVFLFEHARAIAALSAAYAAFKIGSFLTHLASVARGLQLASTVATATTVATTAASTAATSASSAMSLFAKAINLVRANPAILAVAAAATYTGAKLIELASVMKENAAAQDLLAKSEAQAATAKQRLVDKVGELIAANENYAQTAVATAEEIAATSEEQAEAYARQLQGAVDYYKAIATQAKLAGDAAGLETARERVVQLNGALDLTRQHLAFVAQASDAAFQRYGKFAEQAADSFDALIGKGEQAKRAVDGLFKELDLTTPQGLVDAGQAIELISARGKEAGASIRDELRRQILQLSDQDFAKLQASAQSAFRDGKAGAESMRDALAGINLQRLGVDVNAIKTGFTAAGEAATQAFQRAVTEVGTLGLTADQQSQAVAVAFDAAFAKASTSAELESLRDALGHAADEGIVSAQVYQQEIERVATALANLNGGLQKTGTQGAQGLQQVQQQAQQTGEAIQQTGEKGKKATDELSGASAALSSAIQENRQAFLDLSDGATTAFDTILFNLSKTQVAFGTQHAAGELLQTIADAAEIVRNKVDAQRQALDATIANLNQYGQAGAAAFGEVGFSAEQTAATLEGQIIAIQEGRSQFDLLGEQDLGRLQAALESARQRVEALQQQAEAAKDRLSDLGSELQDQIDQINGNASDIENRRYQEQLAQIAELEKQGGTAAAAEADARRKQAEELHQLKLRQLNEESAARKQADEESTQRERTKASATASTEAAATPRRTEADININLNGAGGALGLDLSKLTVQQKEAFARELGPPIIAWLKRQKQLAGV